MWSLETLHLNEFEFDLNERQDQVQVCNLIQKTVDDSTFILILLSFLQKTMATNTSGTTDAKNRKCAFCDQVDSKYCCPRCGRFYCQSECYRSKSHLQCSEQFYRKCVLDTLKFDSKGRHPEVRKKTLEILKRDYQHSCQESPEFGLNKDEQEEQEQEEEIDPNQLDQLLRSLDLDDPTKLWQQLNDKQKKEFEELIQSEAIFNLVPPNAWQPWYVEALEEESIKVQEEMPDIEQNFSAPKLDPSNKIKEKIDVSSSDDEQYLEKEIKKRIKQESQQCPPRPVDIVPLSRLSTRPVSPLIKHSIINVLFNYCLLCRHFGGDLRQNCEQVVDLLMNHSLLNAPTIVFSSTAQALQYSIQRWIQFEKISSKSACAMLEDLVLILSDQKDRRLYLNMLADVIHMLEMRKEIEKRKLKKDIKFNFNAIHKKSVFYLSWVNENGDLLKEQISEIQLEFISMESGLLKEKSNREIKLHD